MLCYIFLITVFFNDMKKIFGCTFASFIVTLPSPIFHVWMGRCCISFWHVNFIPMIVRYSTLAFFKYNMKPKLCSCPVHHPHYWLCCETPCRDPLENGTIHLKEVILPQQYIWRSTFPSTQCHASFALLVSKLCSSTKYRRRHPLTLSL